MHVPAFAPPAAQSAGGEIAQALRVKHTARRVEGPADNGKATAQRVAARVQQQKVEALAQQRLRPLSLEELHYIKEHRAMEGLLRDSRDGYRRVCV